MRSPIKLFVRLQIFDFQYVTLVYYKQRVSNNQSEYILVMQFNFDITLVCG